MQYIVPVMSYTNYSIINITNLYNFLYLTLKSMTKDEQIRYIESLSLILGKTHKNGLKNYIFEKFHKSEILDLFS